MIRWLFFIWGMILVLMVVLFNHYRSVDYIPDSISVIVAKKGPNKMFRLDEHDFRHQQNTLFTTNEAIISFNWTPSGEWLLVRTDDPQANTTNIYRVHASGRSAQLLYSHLNSVKWGYRNPTRLYPSRYRDEFALIMVKDNDDNPEPQFVLLHMNIDGEVLASFNLKSDDKNTWRLEWLDTDILQLFDLHETYNKHDYVIEYNLNLKTGELREIEPVPIYYANGDSIYDISPNKRLQITRTSRGIELHRAEDSTKAIWIYSSDELDFYYGFGWSNDNEWIALNAIPLPYQDATNLTDLYMIPANEPKIRRLTADQREKGFVLSDISQEYAIHPFSPRNEWLLFGNDTTFYHITALHAVRTDGSRQEITNLVPPGDLITAAQWSPPRPDRSIDRLSLFFSGIGLIFVTIGYTWWSWRREMAWYGE